MEHRFSDLIDIAKLQELFDRFYAAVGIPIGITDIDSSIRAAAGWQDICVKFHRVHPVTADRCRKSDAYIQDHLEEASVVPHRCQNGLWDVGVPIRIDGQHLATLFIGQFLFEGELPERSVFVAQAEQFGFDKEQYLAALDRLPVFSRSRIDAFVAYFVTLVNQLVDEGINRKKRLQAEEELNRHRALLNEVIEGTTDAVFVKDKRGRYLMANTQAAAAVGKPVEEIIGRDDTSLFREADAAAIMAFDREVMAHGSPLTREENLQTVQGSRSFLATKGPVRDESGTVVGMFGISRDITERKQLEEKLRQSLKMESVGRLAGGVAHDFNNKLTVILGYAELVRHHVPHDDTLSLYLDEIEKAAGHSQELTGQLLAFSRQQVVAPRSLDLNLVVKETARTLLRLIGEDIELELQLCHKRLYVKLDPSQLDQIIMNLAVNARDAMPAGGTITIGTTEVSPEQMAGAGFTGGVHGPYVRISFGDTGKGMDAQTRRHIFEPYFTTKEPGKGTGLGLATVYGIVTQNGGYLEVHSEEGNGTVFQIFLPVHGEPPLPLSVEGGAAQRGSGKVLLVEDDDEVRTMTTTMLAMLGYTVQAVGSPAQAIEYCEEAEATVDLVVTDLIMPGMCGKEMAERLKALRSEIEFVFMSGYTPEIVSSRGMLEKGDTFITKPFQMLDLAAKMAECLRRRAARLGK